MKRFILPLITIALALLIGAFVIHKCSDKRPPGKDAILLPEKQLPLRIDTVPKIISVDTAGRTHIRYEARPEWSDAQVAYVRDTMAPTLQIAFDEIVEQKEIRAKLEGEVAFYKAELDKANNEKRFYKTQYMTITVNNRNGMPADSSTATYDYNAVLYFTDTWQRKNIFSRKRYYTDIYSPDSNFRIVGMKRYRREITQPRTYMTLSAFGEGRMGLSKELRFQRADVGLQAEFNTDGLVSPYVRVGYGVDSTMQFSSSLQVGGKVNLLRARW